MKAVEATDKRVIIKKGIAAMHYIKVVVNPAKPLVPTGKPKKRLNCRNNKYLLNLHRLGEIYYRSSK